MAVAAEAVVQEVLTDPEAMAAASLRTAGTVLAAAEVAVVAQTAAMRCRAVATAQTAAIIILVREAVREVFITVQVRLQERTEEEGEGEDKLLRMPQVPPMEAPARSGTRRTARAAEEEATVAALHQQVAAATPASTGQEEEAHAT
jgi:hypothetical protein